MTELIKMTVENDAHNVVLFKFKSLWMLIYSFYVCVCVLFIKTERNVVIWIAEDGMVKLKIHFYCLAHIE